MIYTDAEPLPKRAFIIPYRGRKQPNLLCPFSAKDFPNSHCDSEYVSETEKVVKILTNMVVGKAHWEYTKKGKARIMAALLILKDTFPYRSYRTDGFTVVRTK